MSDGYNEEEFELGQPRDSGPYEEREESKPFNRHISSVISQFAASKDGYSRLLNEIDDFVHVVSKIGQIKLSSPSVFHFLGYQVDEVTGQSLVDIIHPNDLETFLGYIAKSLGDQTDFLLYSRYVTKLGAIKLLEVRGKPFSEESRSQVILSAREYSSKASQSLDSIVELQIETLQLKRQLEQLLLAKAINPSSYPLLYDPAHNVDDYTESFLFSLQEPQEDYCLFEPRNIPDDLPTLMIPQSYQGEIVNSMESLSTLSNPLSTLFASPQPSDKAESPVLQTVLQPVLGPEKKVLKGLVKVKKRKILPTDLFCLQCGTTKSPEWRTGPEGAKTYDLADFRLCNACGLAYYKKNKKLADAAKKLASQ